jgi:predicted amino acid racemase
MAHLIIKANNIRQNILKLSKFFEEHGVVWSLITKVFSGDKEFLANILTDDVILGIHSVGDSRLTSLKNLRTLNPKIRTIYIKPPAIVYAEDIVRYSSVSLNSSLGTIKALNSEAKKQDIIHQVIIMIELGELREGVERTEIINFYEQVFELSNIEVIGIGSNLGCMYGVEPTYDKLIQLSLFKNLIAAKFNRDLPLISGGTSITLPLIKAGNVPKDINHYRIGEAAFFGLSPLDNQVFEDLSTDTFRFYANIIELEEKSIVPDGVLSDGNVGHGSNYANEDLGKTSFKAIIDVGLLDVNAEDLRSFDESLEFVGITSDMIVLDLGDNLDENGKLKYAVGDTIEFIPNYMGVARLLNSKFIDKQYL